MAGWLVQPHLNIVVSPDGTVSHLEPRVMEVLQCLALHPGEVLSREQIIRSVWRETYVSEDALSRCILELRKVFGDNSREPHTIRTVPKRGYCLVAPVTFLQSAAERYETLQVLGQGPLSRVLLARDNELRRMVVLKFSAPGSSTDPKSRRRLLHEARAAAGLDNPYICKIFDCGELHGEPYVAMEYVAGETLKQRLSSGPLPLEDALKVAIEIAEALETAHSRGVVHRDIKPANIMLTSQGHVKVLDFGIAKLLSPAAGEEGDSTLSRDGDGSRAGTMPYMSPEQLRGQAVQTTSDIFSFGLVLYEMVAGTHPFHRDSPIDTAAGILNDDPPPLPTADTISSPLLRHIVGKALAKDPSRRYQVVRDARTDLQVLLDEIRGAPSGGDGRGTAPTAQVDARGERKRTGGAFPQPLALALLALAAGIAAVTVWKLWPDASEGPPLLRAAIPVSPAERLAGWIPDLERSAASGRPTRAAFDFSPDGRLLVFCGANAGRTQLYSRPLANDTASPIPGTEGGTAPFFSPDGRRLGFWDGGSLRVIDTSGGKPAGVCAISDPEAPACGADWLSSGEIVFALPSGPLLRVPATGGTPENLTRLEAGEVSHRLPHVLPGGRNLLFTMLACLEQCEPQVIAQSLETGVRRTLVKNGADARYVEAGYLVFARQGTLLAAPFDPDRLTLKGEPVPVLKGVAHASGTWGDFASFAAQFGVSREGHLAYAAGGEFPAPQLHLALLNTDGTLRRLPADTNSLFRPRFSPDGKRIALVSRSRIWMTDTAGSPLREVTPDRKTSRVIWSDKGDSLIFDFATADGGTEIREVTLATGSVRTLVTSDGRQVPGSLHPGGRYLAFVRHARPESAEQVRGSQTDIWVFDRAQGRSHALVQSPHRKSSPEFSPDGRWIAYATAESGESEVKAIPFPPGDAAPLTVSPHGGQEPLWAPDGRRILWRDQAGSVWAAEAPAGRSTRFGQPQMVIEGRWRFRPDRWTRGFDISPYGTLFVVVEVETPPSPLTELVIVAHWIEELRRIVAAR